MKRRVFGGLLAVFMMLAAGMPAGAETALQINGELAPKTQEETLKKRQGTVLCLLFCSLSVFICS